MTAKADGDFRLAFWTHFTNRWPEELSHGEANRLSYRWRLPSVRGFVVAQFLSKGAVGVHIRGEKHVSVNVTKTALQPFENKLKGIFDERFTDGKSFFVKYLRLDSLECANWDRMSDWLHENADAYVAALKTVTGDGA